MADRYSFQSPFSRGAGGDPWFTLGSVAVNTTTFITGLGVVGILLTVLEGGDGGITGWLTLSPSAITGGQVWRFLTHVIPPGSDFFWALLGLLFFYMIGNQFEGLVGRRAYTAVVGSLIVLPAVLGAVIAVLVGGDVFSSGLSLPFLGLAAGFSAAMPQARSFFNIPFWAIVAFIFLVRLLSLLTLGSLGGLAMLISTGAIGLIMTRSLGFSNVEWIPSVPLPASVTGQDVVGTQSPSRSKSSRKKPKRSKRGKTSHLQSVPTAPVSEAEVDALLDQVNAFGIDSLSKEQKATLERHAEQMRRRRDEI